MARPPLSRCRARGYPTKYPGSISSVRTHVKRSDKMPDNLKPHVNTREHRPLGARVQRSVLDIGNEYILYRLYVNAVQNMHTRRKAAHTRPSYGRSTRIGGIRTPRQYIPAKWHTHTPAQAPCGVRATEARDPVMRGKTDYRRRGEKGTRKGGGKRWERGHSKTGRHKYCEPVKPSEETRACNIEATPGNCVHDEAQMAETSEVVG